MAATPADVQRAAAVRELESALAAIGRAQIDLDRLGEEGATARETTRRTREQAERALATVRGEAPVADETELARADALAAGVEERDHQGSESAEFFPAAHVLFVSTSTHEFLLGVYAPGPTVWRTAAQYATRGARVDTFSLL